MKKAYYPLPDDMNAIRELRPSSSPSEIVGGRAPGTLSPRSTSTRRRAANRRTPSLSRSFLVHSQRERILDAVAQLSAALDLVKSMPPSSERDQRETNLRMMLRALLLYEGD